MRLMARTGLSGFIHAADKNNTGGGQEAADSLPSSHMLSLGLQMA